MWTLEKKKWTLKKSDQLSPYSFSCLRAKSAADGNDGKRGGEKEKDRTAKYSQKTELKAAASSRAEEIATYTYTSFYIHIATIILMFYIAVLVGSLAAYATTGLMPLATAASLSPSKAANTFGCFSAFLRIFCATFIVATCVFTFVLKNCFNFFRKYNR